MKAGIGLFEPQERQQPDIRQVSLGLIGVIVTVIAIVLAYIIHRQTIRLTKHETLISSLHAALEYIRYNIDVHHRNLETEADQEKIKWTKKQIEILQKVHKGMIADLNQASTTYSQMYEKRIYDVKKEVGDDPFNLKEEDDEDKTP